MTDEAIVNAHRAEARNGYEGPHGADHPTCHDDLNDTGDEPPVGTPG